MSAGAWRVDKGRLSAIATMRNAFLVSLTTPGPFDYGTADEHHNGDSADTQLAKEVGEREMREVAAKTEEDTDAEIQALTQKCAVSQLG